MIRRTWGWIAGLCLIYSQGFGAEVPFDTIADVTNSRSSIWCETCPGGRLKTFVEFKIKTEVPDLALGGDYFPITDLVGKPKNITAWSEETARSGAKYSFHIIEETPAGFRGRPPSNYDFTRLYNGKKSWTYRPRDDFAEQKIGITRATQVVQDYFGDMIGTPIESAPRSSSRTIPSGSDAPFGIDEVLSSGLYKSLADEAVDGEPASVIERSGLDRIWFANQRGYPVIKREWRWSLGGPLKRRIINGDLRRIAEGTWLPFTSRMEIFGHPTTHPDMRVGILEATVRKAESNISDDEFEPKFRKGTLLTDLDSGKTSRFGLSEMEQVERSKKALTKMSNLIASTSLGISPEPWWKRSAQVICYGLAIVALACVVYMARRRQ